VLTQEVVYDTLLLSQRKDLHAQVGAAIEALYPGRLEEHYEALADHYSQSDERSKAIDYLDKAGDKATANFSQQEARARYQQAAETFDGSTDRTNKRHFSAGPSGAQPCKHSWGILAPLAGGRCSLAAIAASPAPSGGLPQQLAAKAWQRHSTVWTCGSGWVRMKTQRFAGARPSGRPVERGKA
jgi:hypothetical protein